MQRKHLERILKINFFVPKEITKNETTFSQSVIFERRQKETTFHIYTVHVCEYSLSS